MSDWSPDQVAELTRLWGEGLTGGEIGKRLGISKNAVVGKVHRLHLPSRPSPIKRYGQRLGTATYAARPVKPHPKNRAAPKPSAPIMPTARAAGPSAPLAESRPTLDGSSRARCVWPLWPSGDLPPRDQRFFCGAKITPGETPYCAPHADTAKARPYAPRAGASRTEAAD